MLLAGCTPPALPSSWRAFFAPRNPAATAPIVLTVAAWPGTPAEDRWLRTTLDQLDELNPAIEIELAPNAAANASATPAQGDPPAPDVLTVSGFALPDLVAQQQLNEIFSGVTLDDIPSVLQPGFTVDGKAYCFPQAADALALYYNRALFDNAGIAYPDADWTWSEFATAAEALTDPNITAYGLVMPADLSRWLPFYFAAGGRAPTDGVLTLDPDPAQQATEFLAGLFTGYIAAPPDATASTWSGEAFGKGRAGMVVEGTWLAAYLAQRYPNLNYGIAELPVGHAGRGTLLFTSCLGASATSAHRDLAQALAAQLAHPQTLEGRGDVSLELPPYTSMMEHWKVTHPDLFAFADALAYGWLWQLGPDQEASLQAFNSTLQIAFDGDIDAAEAVSRFPFVAGTAR